MQRYFYLSSNCAEVLHLWQPTPNIRVDQSLWSLQLLSCKSLSLSYAFSFSFYLLNQPQSTLTY